MVELFRRAPRDGDDAPVQQPTPTQRAVFGLLVAACALCIPLVSLARPVVLGIVVQTALLAVLALLYWRWLRGSVLVAIAAALPFAAAVAALVMHWRGP